MSKLHEYANRVEGAKLDPDNPVLPPVIARAFRHIGDKLDKLDKVLPQMAIGKQDTPLTPIGIKVTGNAPASISQAIDNTAPPPLSFTLTQHGGFSTIVIRLPQNIQPQSSKTAAAIIGDDPNSSLSVIWHRLRSSTNSNFDVASNVNVYGPGTQVVWNLPDTNAFWQIQSSFDGQNFGPWSNI